MNQFSGFHDRLKNSIHTYWRQSTILSPRTRLGKVIMGSLYFSIPVVLGYFVVTKVVDISESTVQERFGGSNGNGNGISSSSSSSSSSNSSSEENNEFEKIGAGGWGGGVNLATSNKETQDVNRINLERFLKKQRKLKAKRERKEAQAKKSKDQQ
jgi:hypothetical protein